MISGGFFEKAVTSCCNERQLHASAMSYGHIRRKRRIPLTDFSAIPSSNVAEPEPYCWYENRGEKLYVTKDKRRPTSWRRCLSWIVACTVISVVLIVAILAGTGVILSDDQNGVKEASVGRNFAGASFNPGVTSKQTNGSNMYVPRSLESELIVDNLDLDPALLDSNSSAYQQFAKNMEDKLKMILFDKEILESAASDIGLRVVNVSRDPFKVNYRIGWNYKEGSNNSVEPIKMEDVKQKLIESLSKNQGYIDKYHIDGENIKVDHVVDQCQMNNGGCSHICYYNYITQLFTCTCPTHLVLDNSRKNCVEWTGPSEEDFLLVPDRNSHPDVDMNFQQNVHYHLENQKDENPQPEPQPNEHDHAHELLHHGGHHNHDHDHEHHHVGSDQEPAAEPEPEPEPEPTAEPAPEPTAEPAPEPAGGAASEDSDANKKSDSDNNHWYHPDVYVHGGAAEGEATPEPSPEPSSDVDKEDGHHSSDHFDHSKDHEPSAEPNPEPNPESSSDSSNVPYKNGPDGATEHSSKEDDSKTEIDSSKIHDSNSQSTMDHEGNDNEDHHYMHAGAGFIPAADHEPSAEPTPEPGSDNKENTHDSHTGFGFAYSGDRGESQEPSAEPTPEPSSDSDDHEKSHPDNYGHHESTDSSTEQNPISRNPSDSTSNVYIHRGTDESTSDPNHSTNNNQNLHTSFVTNNEQEKEEEPVAEPTPEPGSNDQDHIEKLHSNMDREPSDELKRIQETDPHSITHLVSGTESRPNDESQNEQPNSSGSGIYVGREDVSPVGSTQKPASDSTSDHETTTPHIETQPGHEGQITESRQNDPTLNSQPGVSIIQTQHTGSETTTEPNSNTREKEPQSSEGIDRQKEREQLMDQIHTMTHFNMKPEETEGKTVTESNVDYKHPEQSSESQMGVHTQTFSGQRPENENQRPESGVYVNNGNVGSNTESTPQQASEPKEHDNLNKNEQKPAEQNDKTVTDSFHEYILGQGNFKPESKEGEVAPKGSGDEFSMATTKPDASANREVDSSQTPTTLSPHMSMGSMPGAISGSVLEQILLNDSISHPIHGVHERTDKDSQSNAETTDRQVPSSQDILNKESSPSTISNHPDGQSVSESEVKNNNEPTIDKSSPQSTESNTAQGMMSDDKMGKSETGRDKEGESEHVTSNSNYAEGDKNIKESTTVHPGIVIATGRDSSGVTLNPTVVEYVAPNDFRNSAEKKEDEMKTTEGIKGLEVTEPSNVQSKGYEVTELTSETEPSTENPKFHFGFPAITQQPVKTGEDEQSSTNSESDSKKPTNEFEKSKIASVDGDEIIKTTLRPENNRERATIPVTIIAGDFPSPYDGSLESKEIFQRIPNRESTESHLPDENIQKYKSPSGSVENGPKDSTTDSYQTGGSGSKLPQSESADQGTVSVHGSDPTGTTKNPDDFSNNIKDENEDFNALIEQETGPGEGKEILLSKFANKYSKPDKKKLKDFDKKFGEGTTKSGITPEDYSLQKHVKGNENGFDLDYSFPREHTTVPDIVSHVVPGVSFNQHGINNHDISILQTVTPDLKTETIVSGDIRSKSPDSKEVDKDYSKFDKDYKYKEKGGKKKDLKKKIGGKDGKNVELDDSRKYFTDSMEEVKDLSDSTQTPTFERVGPIVFNNKEYEGLLPREESEEVTTGGPGSQSPKGQGFGGPTIAQIDGGRGDGVEQGEHYILPIGQGFGGSTTTQINGGRGEGVEQGEHNIQPKGQGFGGSATAQINGGRGEGLEQGEHYITGSGGQITNGGPSATNATSPGTVYDGQFQTFTHFRDPNQSSQNQTVTYIPGTIFDGVSHRTIPPTTFTQRFVNGDGGQYNTTFVVYETTLPNGTVVVTNTSSTAHPTIIVRGQSGSLQDGHTVKSFDLGNGTFAFPENYQFKFSNGSTVHPTIVIRGQSGALQDGHESRFVNGTFGGTNGNYFGGPRLVTNSTVYRIENGSLPGTVFDGHFNPQEGHYHMFTNASGTFVYSNATSQPTFVIKGSSGDFGNSKGYILGNQTRTVLNHTLPSNWFNTTGFSQGIHEVLSRPQNETIKYTHQITPSSFSSSYDYTVNNYFGYISKCAAGQFQCVNGTSKRGSACISLSSKCDSINDCSDGSDELGCIESGCPGNFQCSDGSCLKRHLVCNGIVDCSDGSDEQKCESWKCEFDEFQCPSGRCIPVVWQCDNKPDCDNHTDEYNCQTSCGNDEYLCPEGWCIPLTYKCNGVKECSNGEDEQLCDCSLDEFKCNTGGCVSKTSVCNGLDDCPDRSDEWGCVQLEPETNLIKIRTASGNYEPICADGWTTQHSDEVCASLGFSSSVPLEVENSASSITNEKSFFVLKSNRTEHFSKKLLVNLMKGNETCSSGKLVEISCQEFSCGSRSMTDSSSVEARLVGGKTATAGQWPSVALLYNVRNLHSCTANVLTPRWVLASYNCLKMGNKNLNQQDWKMFGGSTVFETEKETAETRNIVSIIPHPQVKFNQFLFSNDLALVELDEPLYFTSNMGAVCLPEQEIQPRQICVTAGWGMNAPEDKVIRQQLQYLPVPTMNLTECNSTEHYSGFITEDKICAGYNAAEKSLCYNEEGAPLMCVNDRGEWELQGVLSYHSNCGRGSHPSIFSSITPAKEWIKQTIGNSFDRKVVPVTKR